MATVQSRTPPPLAPVPPLPGAGVLPSGLNATDITGPVGPVSGLPTGWWVATSHNCAVPSLLPKATVAPSGLNATEVTFPEDPVRAPPTWRWVATSHRRTVPSLL